MQLAHWWQAAGATRAALHALDEGAASLGQLVVFIELAVDLEMTAGRPERALRRMRALPNVLATHPRWLLRQAAAFDAQGQGVTAEALLDRAEGLIVRGETRGDTSKLLAQIDALRE